MARALTLLRFQVVDQRTAYAAEHCNFDLVRSIASALQHSAHALPAIGVIDRNNDFKIIRTHTDRSFTTSNTWYFGDAAITTGFLARDNLCGLRAKCRRY